jgi:hypothetical protein
MNDHEISAAVQEAIDALAAKGHPRAYVSVRLTSSTQFPTDAPADWGFSIYGKSMSEKLSFGHGHASAAEAIDAMRAAIAALPSPADIAATLGINPDGSMIETAYGVAAE